MFALSREAVKYCEECQGYCCRECSDIHNGFPGLKSHTLLDKSNYKPSGLPAGLPAVPTERCRIHDTKIVDMYCGNHDEVGCTTCMALNHRSCVDVHSVTDSVDSKFQKTELDKIHKKLQDMKIMMETIMMTKQKLIDDLKKSKTEAATAIKDFRKDMEIILERLEKESIKELETKFMEEESRLTEEKKKATAELDGLIQALSDLKKSEGNKAQQFVSMKISQQNIAKTEDVSNALQTRGYAKISFIFDPAILDYLQQFKSFGSATSLLSPRTTVYSVKSIENLNMRGQNDEACVVYESCLTEDGALLLADNNNKKIKRADIVKLSVTDYCSVPAGPIGVCCTSKIEAAVCLNNKTIQFVNIGKQMTTSRQIKLNHYCFGIGCRDDKLYITDSRRSLYIHDMTGNLLQTLTQNNAGQNMFPSPRAIAFSDVDDKVYVASWNNGLVAIDGQGKHRQTFTDSELSKASGVCTDHRGNMFVSGYSSNNVIQIGRDCKKMGVVVKSSDGLKSPLSVCFDTRQCKLLVITEESSDVVKIIHLQ